MGISLKEEILMANKHLKRYLTTLVLRIMQIKAPIQYHETTIKMTKIKNTCHTKCLQKEAKGMLSNADVNVNWHKDLGNQCPSHSKINICISHD